MKYSELKASTILPNFTMEQFGRDKFIFGNPEEEDIRLAKEGLKKDRKNINFWWLWFSCYGWS